MGLTCLFFKNALEIIGNNGVIHYYDIQKEEKIAERINDLKKIAKESRNTLKILNISKIKTYAPGEFFLGIDIMVKKK